MLYDDVVLLVWLVGCARVVLVLILLYLTLINYTVFVIVILLKTNNNNLLRLVLETGNKIQNPLNLLNQTQHWLINSVIITTMFKVDALCTELLISLATLSATLL